MREMKDCGIAWNGLIPATWETRKGKFVLSLLSRPVREDDEVITCFRDGQVTLRKNRREEGFTLSDKEIGYQGIEPGDLVIHGMDGFAGSIGISDSRGKATPVLNVCDSKEDKRYLMYYLRSMAYNDVFTALATGIRVRSCDLRWKKLSELPYLLPSSQEQAQIVSTIENKSKKVDALIANEQKQIEKLKQYKQSLITEVVTKGLDPSAPMKDSGVEWIGEMPTTWDEIKLKYCTYIRARLGWKGLKSDEYVEEGYPLLSAYNIINSKLDFYEVNFINQFRYDESPEIKLAIDDILLVKDGAGIGKCAIVEDLQFPSTANGSLAVVTAVNRISPKYLYYYLLSAYFQKYIDRIKDGMGVPHLFQSDLREIMVVIPSEPEQREIIVYLESNCAQVDKLISIKQAKIEKLNAYKKSLIYEYVTGKKEVT